MRAVPRLCELYAGIYLTNEEKARENLSKVVVIWIISEQGTQCKYNIKFKRLARNRRWSG
jgi:hypothetical protein